MRSSWRDALPKVFNVPYAPPANRTATTMLTSTSLSTLSRKALTSRGLRSVIHSVDATR